MEPYQRTLFLLGTLVLPETWAGSHSLRPELGEPRFFSVGYVDDQQVVSFDSGTERQREEPRTPWMYKMHQEDPDHWGRNTRTARAHAQIYRVGLEKLLNCFKQSEGGGKEGDYVQAAGNDSFQGSGVSLTT